MDWQTAWKLWAFDLEAEGRSPHTIAWYGSKVRQFGRHCDAEDIALDAVSKETIRGFLRDLRQAPAAQETGRSLRDGKLAPLTLKGYVQVLRQFFAWAAADGLLDANPASELRPLRVPPVQVQAFSADDVRAMLQVAQRSRHALRDVAILTLLYDTGIRASELTSLTLGVVDLESGWCQVRGKGGKARSVPLGRAARRALLRYISSGRPEPALPSDTHLFLNQTRHPLTRSGLYRLVRQTSERAGIRGKRLSPHTLRHAAADKGGKRSRWRGPGCASKAEFRVRPPRTRS